QLADLMSDDLPVVRLQSPAVTDLATRRRHSRWLAPAVAAAAVAAVAVVAFALSSGGSSRITPAPPASRASSASPSASPTTSSEPTANKGQSTGAAQAYLPAGKTGSRTDVPWSAVGSGWRLVQPNASDGTADSLYLHDPAGGRYLITDQLPRQTYLQAWSPDGQRAMFQVNNGSDDTRFRQLDLSSGQLDAGFTQHFGLFLRYTQPRGLAVLVTGQVQGTDRLLRYSADGTLQLAYPPIIAGQRLHEYYPILYTADGSQLVAQTGNSSVLLSNGGELVQQYSLPGSNQSCRPVKWWTADTFLEACDRPGSLGSVSSLYLQPVAGGTPNLLVDQGSSIGMGYGSGWQLSNGDVLLSRRSGCGSAGYDILHPDGTTVPLRLPAGVPEPGTITSLVGDLATFRVVHGCGQPGPNVTLLDYDMVTGATSTLLDSDGIVVGYPGD
ncbi:MAG TPA: hypothetical protein VFD94_02915, partial [Jatrophihabitans sp.]|nr:hypothetical protein [Jatrophihabitans sp.]